MNGLKPCPFCKGNAVFAWKVGVMRNYVRAVCGACGATQGWFRVERNGDLDAGVFIAWNARPIEDRLRRERDEARAEVERMRREMKSYSCPECRERRDRAEREEEGR